LHSKVPQVTFINDIAKHLQLDPPPHQPCGWAGEPIADLRCFIESGKRPPGNRTKDLEHAVSSTIRMALMISP